MAITLLPCLRCLAAIDINNFGAEHKARLKGLALLHFLLELLQFALVQQAYRAGTGEYALAALDSGAVLRAGLEPFKQQVAFQFGVTGRGLRQAGDRHGQRGEQGEGLWLSYSSPCQSNEFAIHRL